MNKTLLFPAAIIACAGLEEAGTLPLSIAATIAVVFVLMFAWVVTHE